MKNKSLTPLRVFLFLALALILVACGGAASPTALPGEQPPAEQPPAEQPPAGEQPPAAEDLQTRVSDSYNRTLGFEAGTVLGSLHLEITATEPSWDFNTNQVVTRNWTLSADIQEDDWYLILNSDGEVTEGWYIDSTSDFPRGLGPDGQESFTVAFAFISVIGPAIPLAIAATGPTAQGTEVIERRTAEKYGVDSANAPPGVLEVLQGIIFMNYSRGTVWVDSQTGALLRAVLDYEQEFADPENPETVVGTGTGHIEITVTQIGQVTVQPPG